MRKPKTGTIYALDDPRDGSTRYIGKTTQDPLDRLAGHLATPTNPAMRVWINALGAQGLVPRMRSLKTVTIDKLDAEEKQQIDRHARAGHRLLNAPHYHQNLTDLLPPLGVATDELSKAQTPGGVVERVASKIYGPTAEHRAAGRISSTQAAVRVLTLAPTVSLAILFLIALEIRWVRRIIWTCGVVTYLWKIGFSRIVQDFLFPHLPVDGIARFWLDYLAHPVHTLAWNLLVVVFLVALGSYLQVAEAAQAAQPKRRGRCMGTSSLWDDMDPVDRAALAAAALDGAIPKTLPPGRP